MADLKELADKGNALFNAHDAAGLSELDAEDVVLTTPGPTGRVELRGKAAGQEYNQGWFDAFPDAKIQIVNEVISADCICDEGILTGTHTGTLKTAMGDIPATGKVVSGQYALISQVRDGKIAKSNLYFDLAQFMFDLGLAPAPAEAGAATA